MSSQSLTKVDLKNMAFKQFFRYQLIICLFSIAAGIFLSNYTADIVGKPAANVMKLVTGGKTTSPARDDRGIPKVFYPKLVVL